MANNQHLDLLFKVAGGASLDSGSGHEIKKAIEEIVGGIQRQGITELDFKASKTSLEKLKKDIKAAVQNIPVTFDGKSLGTKDSASSTSGRGFQNLKTETGQMQKLVSLYKEYNNYMTKAAKATPGSDEQAFYSEKALSKLKEARQLRKDYNLDGKRTAQINQLIRDAHERAADAAEQHNRKLTDQQRRLKQIADTPIKDTVQLNQMEQKLIRFKKEFATVSAQGFLDPKDLDIFSTRFDEIEEEFRGTVGKAEDFKNTFGKMNQGDIDRLLAKIKALSDELKNAHTDASQFVKQITKDQNGFNKLANRAQDYYNRIQKTLARNPAMQKELETLIQRLHNMDFRDVAEGSAEFQKLQYQIKQAGLESENLWQTINRMVKTKFGYGIAGAVALQMRRQLTEVYNAVVDIDTKMTELQIVSGATGTEMVRVLDEAADAAKRVASSITDIIDATTVYRRLGFDVAKSLDFAELTTMYSKVGGVDMGEAESNLTAIIKAFGLENVDDLRMAMDQLVQVGNNYAISAAELGVGFNNASSALVAAGNSYEESLALLTAANTITQDASKSSTAIRTIAARLTQSSAELEELGEEIDEAYTSTAKYREKLLAMTGVDILQENGEDFRSTAEILGDLSKVWKDLSNVDQSAITYMVAGIRQSNVFSSLMTQWSEAEGVMQTAADASGAMSEAYEAYVDSIEGRMNTLIATFQDLSTTLLDSDVVKTAVSGLTSLIDVIDKLIEHIELLPLALGGVGIWQFAKSVGGAKMIALLSAPTYVPVVTRNECAA